MYIQLIIRYNIFGGDKMAKPKTKTNAEIHNDYMRKKYDDIRMQVPKGKKEIIKAHAIKKGFGGIIPYINNLIDKDMNDT